LIFGEPGAVADGGIFYDNAGSNAMEFRTTGTCPRLHRLRRQLHRRCRCVQARWRLLVGDLDGRLKKNVVPLEHALDRLLALRGVSFEYAQPDATLRPPGVHIGFIAQEVQPVFPRWVATGPTVT
jgi:hypothetical protein